MKTLYILILTFFIAGQAFGQLDSVLSSQLRLNIAVPDLPAFKAVGSDASKILRPSDIKSIALMFSDFKDANNNFAIPKSFAAEIAPGLLFPTSFSAKKYETNPLTRLLYNTRLSLATNVGGTDTNSRKMSAGIRFVIINDGDFRKDHKFLYNDIIKLTDKIVDVQKEAKNVMMTKYNLTAAQLSQIDIDKDDRFIKIRDSITENKDYLQTANKTFSQRHPCTTEKDRNCNPEYQHIIDSLKGNYLEFIKKNDASINTAISNYKKNHWNANRLEIAFAPVAYSPNTNGKNVFLSSYSIWAVGAIKFKTWGQLLIGLTGSFDRTSSDSAFRTNAYLPIRLYGGSNKFKGFVEVQGTYKSATPTLAAEQSILLNAGAEVNITDGIWLNFSMGVNNVLGANPQTQLVSNAHLFFTIPEKVSIF